MNNFVLIILTIAAIMGLGAIHGIRRERALLERTFAGRASLSADQFHQQNFEHLGIPRYVSVGVREVLAREIGADLNRVAPSDSFTGNLAFLLEGDGLVDVSIIEGLEKYFSLSISDSEAESMHTVEDIVRLVAEKVKNRGAAA